MKNNYISGISGKTRVCGIIGDPISHTMSPPMHNAAFRHLGLDYVYVPFRVEEEGIGKALQGIKALNIRGINVTVPHKISVISFLDEVDSLAESIGAVNTVVNSDGILKGYNTDALGFWRSLSARNIGIDKKKIVLLGAGGAARAIAFILADKGFDITIINRHLEKAAELADSISRSFPKKIHSNNLTRENLAEAISDAEILINTTSVGMSPQHGKSLVPGELISSSQIVIDIIYNPLKTKLLDDAEKRGAKIVNGIEMLVWQGVAAFELWTGQNAPVEVMRDAVLKNLGKNEN